MLKKNVYAEFSAKITVITLMALFCMNTFLYADYTGSVITDSTELSFSQLDDFDIVSFESDYFTEEEGAPQLPVKILKYVIPIDVSISDIVINSSEQVQLDGDYYIYPSQPPCIFDGGDTSSFVEPKKEIYDSINPYPGKLVEVIGDECTMGYHVVTLRFFPVEYIPSEQKLNVYTNIDFTIEYENITSPIRQARRQSLSRYNTSKKLIKNMVENPNDFESVTGGAIEIVQEQTIMSALDIRMIPSPSGSLPEYIIITNNQLEPVFEDLTEWKTKKGVPALIITVEDIADNYVGCDLQEMIRHYLQDARYYWGDNLYVLLGGDTNIIPDRVTPYPSGSIIPTDLYYSDIYRSNDPDYNWNANGNNVFGESGSYPDGDNIDGGADIFIGRASVENEDEAITFVNKVISYERLDDQGYDIDDINNVLLMTAFVGDTNNGVPSGSGVMADYEDIYNDSLPDWARGWRMFDDYDGSAGYNTQNPGDEETCHDNFVDALDHGSAFPYGNFHIVHHVDHSYNYRMGTSQRWKGECINRADMDGLQNIPYQILITGGCEPNEFNLDCIAEHYINNPNGGGVAIIAHSARTGYGPQLAQKFCKMYYGSEVNGWNGQENRLGGIFIGINSTSLSIRKSLNLLGDPEMPVWSNAPVELLVELTPSEITNGENTINVTINNLQENVDALVCLQKGNEAYGHATVTGTGGNISAIFTITPDTPGEVDVTVTAHNYLPYEDTIPVNLTSYSHLYITEKIFDDDQSGSSYGNGDGQIDAGETIELSLKLTNSGTLNAADVSAEITCNSDYITITQNQSDFGDINAGESAVSQTNYVFEVDKDTPDGQYVSDTLFIYEGTALLHTDVFYFQIGAPELNKEKISVFTIDGDDIIEAGETVELKIELFNEGAAEATGVSAVLSTDSPVIIITQNTVSYGDIAPLSSSDEGIDPFVFTISEDYDGETLNLEITNEYGRIWQFNEFNLNKPNPVAYESITFAGYLNEIDLSWEPVPDYTDPQNPNDNYYIRGYIIYRDNGLGVYEKLNNFIVEGTSYYQDTKLDPVTSYHYKIAAVTESGRESDQTNSYEAWTTLPYLTNWPVSIDVGDNIHGSINVCDNDLDGQKEVFTTILGDGYLLGFDTNGEELYDLDNDPGTVSGFVSFDAQIWSTPVLGDIDGDGLSDVVATTRHDGSDEKKLFVYKTLDDDQDGEPDLLWSSDIGEQAWRGPIISDINNDGTLEVIAVGVNGIIKVYDSQGNVLWYEDAGAGGYGIPAVADLDDDGYKEIIMGSKDGVFIWQYDGSNYVYETNPVFSLENKWFVAPPVVVDLDGDGDYEIMVVATENNSLTGYVYALHDDGTLVSGWNDDSHDIPLKEETEPPALAVGDIDNNGDIEVVIGGYGRLHAWNHDGTVLNQEFPIYIPSLNVWASAPLLADIDGDDGIEIIMASRDHKIHAYHYDGTKVTGWPLITDDLITASPCIADIDNDGKNEIIAGNYSGTVYVWETEGDPSKIEWGCYRNNAHNTGVYNGSMTLSGTLSNNEYWIEDVYVVGNVVVPSGVDLVIDNSCRVYLTGSTSLTIETGGSIEIGEHAQIYSCGYPNEISISGDIYSDQNITFTILNDNCCGILTFENDNGVIEFDSLTCNHWDIENEADSLTISNSEFINATLNQYGNKLFLSSTDFDSSNVYCYYTGSGSKVGDPDDVEINISQCTFAHYTSSYTIYISGYDLYDLNNNTISDCNTGMYLYECGHPNLCTVSGNVIENNIGRGIQIYHSYVDILGNNVISENSYGILAAQNSTISMIGNETNPLQMVYDNTHEEIVTDPGSYPEDVYYNKIYDDSYTSGTPDQYLFRCNLVFYSERCLDAEYNYWGSASLSWDEWDGDNRFSPSDAFDYIPVWDPGTPRDGGIEGAALLYAEADSLIEEEEYEDAKTTYRSIIDLYTLTDYAIYSMRNLLPMETVSGQDFSSLRDYYLTDPNCNINEERTKLSKYLANYCTIKLEQYPEAISFFEAIISDPDTELDSVYAVIDAGYTYLLMENGGKSDYVGKMSELKPKSENEFRIMREYLLSKLFEIVETEQEEQNIEYSFGLEHNYPNPFNSSTSISFSIPLSSQTAELKIYNIKGQVVRELDINTKTGIGSIAWDGRDSNAKQVGSGIYFYKLTADKKETIKKMVLMR